MVSTHTLDNVRLSSVNGDTISTPTHHSQGFCAFVVQLLLFGTCYAQPQSRSGAEKRLIGHGSLGFRLAGYASFPQYLYSYSAAGVWSCSGTALTSKRWTTRLASSVRCLLLGRTTSREWICSPANSDRSPVRYSVHILCAAGLEYSLQGSLNA